MQGKELLCKLNTAGKEAEDIGGILADIPEEVDITRKQATIIIHEYLKRVLHEEDEKDVSKASELKDLYDCRVCVKHIEQVYVKGIMDALISPQKADETGLPVIFGGNEILSDDEADQIIDRIFNKKLRENNKAKD